MFRYIPLYEKQFDYNDWFVIVSLIVMYSLIWLLPKRFSTSSTILLMLFSLASASLFDNSMGAHVFDFYDIMDGPKYTVMDFVAYFLYAPFGYFFIYGYDYFSINYRKWGFYVLGCSILAVGFEWVCVRFGVFHYKNGYQIYYSLPIYLWVQSSTILFYKYISTKDEAIEKS